MSITTNRIGRRTYLVGETFPHKAAIKAEGGHWDGDRKAWWLGDDAKAKALAETLNATKTAPKATAQYHKLPDGTWGVRGKNLAAGGKVTVFKRSGDRKEEVVKAVLSTDADGWQTASIERGQSSGSRSDGKRGRGRWYTDGERNYHGHRYSPNDPRYYSSGQYDDES